MGELSAIRFSETTATLRDPRVLLIRAVAGVGQAWGMFKGFLVWPRWMILGYGLAPV